MKKTSITSGQNRHLVRVVADAAESAIQTLGLTEDEAQSVLEQDSSLLKDVIRKALRKLSKAVWYPLSIDYGKTIKEMVAAGHYGWVSPDIKDTNFPVSGTGMVQVNVKLVHLGKDASSAVVLAHLEANGLRPATLAELLAFGATYPMIQLQFPVVALGSSRFGFGRRPHVPYLAVGVDSDRVLFLYWGDHAWNDLCRFLAVRK